MGDQETCPKCGAPLGEIEETPTGRRLRRCSKGSWDSQARKAVGCDYVEWLETPPQELDETCPKCGAPLVLQVTRFGKKMKRCRRGGWDKEKRQPTGCDYVEWLTGTREELAEECPQCGAPLVLYTSAKGKRLKKCSTAKWDRRTRQASGCPYVEWLNS